jgi:hypothetical protein
MATEKATTYPKIGKRIWLLLRQRLAKSMPTTVGPDFIVSISQMSDASAKSNVLSPLRDLGILDKENKPTELAQRWRHDDEYKTVCDEIRTATYPAALIEAYPEGKPEQREKIKSWFMKNSRVGEMAGKMFADTYILLSQADLTVPEGEPKAASGPRPQRASMTTAKLAKIVAPTPTPVSPEPIHQEQRHGTRRLPSVHIDVQVHISPDTTPEQIDRIFESMSKHLGSYIS